MSQYKPVSVALTNGSTIVTAVAGTTLIANGVTSNHQFVNPADGVVYEIASVDSELKANLAANYAGDTNATAQGTFVKDFTVNRSYPVPYRNDVAVEALVRKAIQDIDTDIQSLITGIGVSNTISTKTSDYTITINDSLLFRADSTSGNITLTLPTAVGIPGRKYIIKKIVSANNVDIATNGVQTIDGVSMLTLIENYESASLVSDGANWMII